MCTYIVSTAATNWMLIFTKLEPVSRLAAVPVTHS